MSQDPLNTQDTPRTAKQGDTVRVHYKGTLDDGNEFDSSAGREPLEFRLGTGQVIAGFERTVDGMQLGETRTARLNAGDAYGTHRADLVVELPKEQFPEGVTPEAGQQLELQQDDGQRIPVMITAVEDETVTLDANHPLAGEALTFEIELVEIV
jgi:peptidylprolyl isomerase